MRLFSTFYVSMDTINNKTIILDNKGYRAENKYDIDMSLDFLHNLKKLIELTIKEMPFSLIRAKLLILISGNENREILNKAEEIVFKNGKNKFREFIWMEYGLLIISAFSNINNKCIFMVHINNQIYGFAGFAGSMITKGIFFENNLSLNWMIEQIKNEMPNNMPEHLIKIKEIQRNNKVLDLEELWNNNEEIIFSLEPEYFYNKTKDINNNIFKNNYISDIIDIGMDKLMKLFFNIK